MGYKFNESIKRMHKGVLNSVPGSRERAGTPKTEKEKKIAHS